MEVLERKFSIIVLGMLFLLLAVSVIIVAHNLYPKPPAVGDNGLPCNQEAFICRDGSAVGRTGKNCDFASCPNSPSVKP